MAANVTSRQLSPATFLCRHSRLRVVINAVAATLGIWLVATVIGRVDLTTSQGTIGPVEVVVSTLLAGLAGWGLLAFLERRTPRAWTIWRAIAIAVLVLSMLGTLGADTAAGTTILSVMHAFAGAIVITGFARTVRGRNR